MSGTAPWARRSSASTGCLAHRWTGRASGSRWTSAMSAQCSLHSSLSTSAWIYRAPRIVNWCPHDQSAISDLEVKWQEHDDVLYFIKYPIEGGGDVTIATVRPETMLADTGVAVHPDDPRYRDIAGKTAILPLVGRKMPIVADEAVDPEFGTGALKVTPGHDPMDYEIGQRHHLEVINGMHLDGLI